MGTPGHTVHRHRATALKITFFSAPCSLWSSDIHSGALQSMSLSLSVCFFALSDRQKYLTDRWIWQTRGGQVLLVALLGFWPCLRALLFCLRFCCHCHHFKRFLLIFNKWWSGGLAWLVAMFTRSVTSPLLLSVYTHCSFDDSSPCYFLNFIKIYFEAEVDIIAKTMGLKYSKKYNVSLICEFTFQWV